MVRQARLGLALRAGSLANVVHRTLRRQGDGVHGRGTVIMAIDPRAIERLARGRDSVLVTGTNGKTTTTHLLARALGDEVAHNYTGANMATGIVTAYADTDARAAAVEVDELHFPSMVAMIQPKVVVLLNASRDQLSRSHEVSRVVTAWADALAESTAVVVANCADPNVVAATPPDRAVWFDSGTRWTHDAQACARCGDLIHWKRDTWSCPCGLSMPSAQFRREGSVVVDPRGHRHDLSLQLPGDFNQGNAVAAVAAAHAMGVPIDTAIARFASMDSAYGRYRLYNVGGRPAQLLLAKNPAGMTTALGLVGDGQVIVGINADDVDGRDTSWLYDAPFEHLAGRQVGAVGRRRHDLALRLEIAGARPIVGVDIHDIARHLPDGNLYLIGNYSNFVKWRRSPLWLK